MPFQAVLQIATRRVPDDEKINSSTHKLEWNCLYRMCTLSAKGVIKVDREVYDKWNSNSGEVIKNPTFSCRSSPREDQQTYMWSSKAPSPESRTPYSATSSRSATSPATPRGTRQRALTQPREREEGQRDLIHL